MMLLCVQLKKMMLLFERRSKKMFLVDQPVEPSCSFVEPRKCLSPLVYLMLKRGSSLSVYLPYSRYKMNLM